MVTDGEHDVCTSWSLATTEDKVAALRQLWEEVRPLRGHRADVSEGWNKAEL